MSLGFAEVISCRSLEGATLVAGAGGIDKGVISSVTVGEVPDIGEWLTGGELILSTFFATTAEPEEQVEFVARIIRGGAAGLIAKPGRYIGSLDPAIVALADAADFPIFEVPSEIRWTHIIQEVTDRLLGDHVAFMRRSEQIHKRLLGVVMGGGGMEHLVRVSTDLLGRPVAFFDDLGRLISSADPEGPEGTDAPLTWSDLTSVDPLTGGDHLPVIPPLPADASETTEVILSGPGQPRLTCAFKPVLTAGGAMGSLAVLVGPVALNELDMRAFEHTVTVAAVEQGRLRILMETEMRMRGDLLDDLLSGRIHETDDIISRFARLSCDLSQGGSVIIAGTERGHQSPVSTAQTSTATQPAGSATARPMGNAVADIENIRSDLMDVAARVIGGRHPHSLVLLKRGSVIAILPRGEDAAIDVTADRLAQELQRLLPEASVSIAIGRPRVSAEGIAASYREAETAMRLGSLLGGHVTRFEDVGSYKLLMSLMESAPQELEGFYHETIAPLATYDSKHDTSLVETLRAFFAADENIAAAAETLFAHRHTVRYRLGRIAEITGLDLRVSDHRERLGLGLKIHELMVRSA